ncbi:SIR2 family protein [Burkholderia multivorans]|nr:SIR2 family protein [Burkholderia multivorans]
MHYNPPGIRGEPRYLEGVARFTKLHGSVDWVQTGSDIRRVGLPFGAESVQPYLEAPGLESASAHELMIYPNAAKDRETSDYPYVELFRDLAAAICRPNSTLVTYGYSFGDEHINRVIRDMLTIPSTHLVVISFDDPLDRIMRTYEELGRPPQISLMIGPALADLQKLTENFLPKAAIDKTTFRMSELLKQRWHTAPPVQKAEGDGSKDDLGIEDLL